MPSRRSIRMRSSVRARPRPQPLAHPSTHLADGKAVTQASPVGWRLDSGRTLPLSLFTHTAAPTRAPAPATPSIPTPSHPLRPALISQEAIVAMEARLDDGPGVEALRRFNAALRGLNAANWEAKLRPVMLALAHNLESFNPAFAAVVLTVQATLGGASDYHRRDAALAALIQPLAGEYGMHNGEDQAKTHRALFETFYENLLGDGASLGAALDVDSALPHPASSHLFTRMMNDLATAGGRNPLAAPGTLPANARATAASYALGYNLAIEYLADYEKTWMLDSFRALNDAVLTPAGRPLTEWVFLEVHAEGEAEHAALGHSAVRALVPAADESVLAAAMADHDRDFAAFYNEMARMLE